MTRSAPGRRRYRRPGPAVLAPARSRRGAAVPTQIMIWSLTRVLANTGVGRVHACGPPLSPAGGQVGDPFEAGEAARGVRGRGFGGASPHTLGRWRRRLSNRDRRAPGWTPGAAPPTRKRVRVRRGAPPARRFRVGSLQLRACRLGPAVDTVISAPSGKVDGLPPPSPHITWG